MIIYSKSSDVLITSKVTKIVPFHGIITDVKDCRLRVAVEKSEDEGFERYQMDVSLKAGDFHFDAPIYFNEETKRKTVFTKVWIGIIPNDGEIVYFPPIMISQRCTVLSKEAVVFSNGSDGTEQFKIKRRTNFTNFRPDENESAC